MRMVEPLSYSEQYTDHAQKQPHITLLEARDICGAATGRNGE